MRARPRSGLPGATDTSFTPAKDPRSAGMSRSWPFRTSDELPGPAAGRARPRRGPRPARRPRPGTAAPKASSARDHSGATSSQRIRYRAGRGVEHERCSPVAEPAPRAPRWRRPPGTADDRAPKRRAEMLSWRSVAPPASRPSACNRASAGARCRSRRASGRPRRRRRPCNCAGDRGPDVGAEVVVQDRPVDTRQPRVGRVRRVVGGVEPPRLAPDRDQVGVVLRASRRGPGRPRGRRRRSPRRRTGRRYLAAAGAHRHAAGEHVATARCGRRPGRAPADPATRAVTRPRGTSMTTSSAPSSGRGTRPASTA